MVGDLSPVDAKFRPKAIVDTLKKDVGRKRGRSGRPTSRGALPGEAPNHGYRREWEAGVSGQGNVLFLFQSPDLLGLAGVSPAGPARQPLVILVLERRLAGLDQLEVGRHELGLAPAG
jgi:hypothetical protein